MTEAKYKKRETGLERHESGRKGRSESFRRPLRANGQGARPYVECIGRGFLQETSCCKWLQKDLLMPHWDQYKVYTLNCNWNWPLLFLSTFLLCLSFFITYPYDPNILVSIPHPLTFLWCLKLSVSLPSIFLYCNFSPSTLSLIKHSIYVCFFLFADHSKSYCPKLSKHSPSEAPILSLLITEHSLLCCHHGVEKDIAGKQRMKRKFLEAETKESSYSLSI